MNSRALVAVAAAAVACTPAGGPGRLSPAVGSLQQTIDSLVNQPKFRNAHWGVLIVDPGSGDTLYSRNAGKLFMPASNQKLLTGSTALVQLGPDYRFRTVFATSGTLNDGTLQGDLLVDGGGDPSISDHMRGDAMVAMGEMADSLIAHGIHRVTGRVRRGVDAFPDANVGYGWAWDDFDYPYSARIDALTFNEGFTRVTVRGAQRPGDAPIVTTAPIPTWPIVRVTATTVASMPADDDGGGDVVRDSTTGGIVVRGAIAVGDSAFSSITYSDPEAAWLEALRWAMVARGITIDERPSVTTGDDDTGTIGAAMRRDTLFTFLSPPLREVLRAFEKPSQNQIGELLLKTLGLERTGVGTADSGAAVVRRQVLSWGAEPDGFVVRDGSGLSRHDVVTPETIVRVLDGIRADTAFHVFYDALPIAGVDGTIASRMRGTAAEGNVHAKTGTLNMVRSLSGYVTTVDRHLLLFSILVNNWTTPVREVNLAQDSIMARVAGMRLRDRR
jgi:D-alanyl-D-alanine carboxypeptidase/D-alanyl-D-alanine-endopeptidase (penicillin-binding protein 4)